MDVEDAEKDAQARKGAFGTGMINTADRPLVASELSSNVPPRLDNHVSGTKFLRSNPITYAGRLGGNQELVVDPSDPDNASLLQRTPDAAPWIAVPAALSLAGFRQVELWKQATMEGVGTMMLSYVTIMIGLSPSLDIAPLPKPSATTGPFGTVNFLGPLVGSVTNIIFVTLFIFCFGSVTGGHLNPLITIATFFGRLTTLPRMVLYVSFQMAGASLAGLLVRASYNSTAFKVGGCFFDPNLVEVRQMFTLEFVSCMTLLFFAFGVGLDPRQVQLFGPALAPLLVGVALGGTALATAFVVPGYGGAGMNPARCFAVYVGSGHSLGVSGPSDTFGYTGKNGARVWIYFVAPLAASMAHGLLYFLIPPWATSGRGQLEVRRPGHSSA